jgi:hypothetical protein
MLTGLAILVHGPGHDFAGAGVFVVVVLALIVLIFMRVYGGGNQPHGPAGHRSRRRTARKSGRQTAHRASHPSASHPPASHPPGRDEDHGHHTR